MNTDQLLETGLLPDWIIRIGIRRLLAQRLKDENKGDEITQNGHFLNFIGQLKQSPVAVHTSEANEEHYEVPTQFFQLVLGKRLKYSSCYWTERALNLDLAEEEMLKLYCERAQIKDGQSILDLGCGWGSLSFWLSEHYPKSKITAVSNSRTQKEFIDLQIRSRGIRNLAAVTSDINRLELEEKFDRVLSIEMFEHMRNYRLLMNKISKWLNPDGLLFVHIFVHRRYAYLFEPRDDNDWMARYFFTGGLMPSQNLLSYFQEDLKLVQQWEANGVHYSKTAESWLSNMDRNKKEILGLFIQTYGKDESKKWWNYWRIFFMSCSELWGYKRGQEWLVTHYLFKKK